MNAYAIWIAFFTLCSKEVRRFMRIWTQTLLPSAITTVLYFVIFGNLIGSRIGEMGGFDYMQYIVPGLIMMAVINNAYMNVVSSFYGNKFQRSLEEMLVSPMPALVILLGFVGGSMLRGLLAGVIVTLLALFFTRLPIHHLGIMMVVGLLTAFLFSCAGFLNALFARNFDDITIIPTFVLTPLIYLGGVFYSIDLLSDFWRNVSLINPILYMVNAFRYGILGVSDIPITFALLLLVAFSVGLFLICWWLLVRGSGIRT